MKPRNKPHKTVARLYRVTINGETHEFATLQEALRFQRKNAVIAPIPAGDYHGNIPEFNPHKRRDVLTYKPGLNPGYKLDKEQQRQARLYPECTL